MNDPKREQGRDVKSNYGLAALIGGFMAVLFGGSGLLALVVLPVTLIAAIFSFLREWEHPRRTSMALYGTTLAIFAAVSGLALGWNGLIYEVVIKPYLS